MAPDESILARSALQTRRFVLGVSSMSPIKNFQRLIDAWEGLGRTDFKLVLAGGHNRKLFQDAGPCRGTNTQFLGYVTDGELRALYENAACFVYPSLYEGFGLPPIEAMSCGCPVIASHCSALPEVCGDAALYCDAYSATDIGRRITEVLDHPELAEELRRRGRQRAVLYTYRTCAAKLWANILPLLD